jgi:hypothetical protein
MNGQPGSPGHSGSHGRKLISFLKDKFYFFVVVFVVSSSHV